MSGNASLRAISARAALISSACARDSRVFGPRMKTSGRSLPSVISPIATWRGCMLSAPQLNRSVGLEARSGVASRDDDQPRPKLDRGANLGGIADLHLLYRGRLCRRRCDAQPPGSRDPARGYIDNRAEVGAILA